MRSMLAAAGLLLTLPGIAAAVTLGGSWSVSGSALSDPGLVVTTRPAPGGQFVLSLEDGRAASVDLFRLWTLEGSVGADDRVARLLDVSFGFSGPDLSGSGTVRGTTVGHRELGLQWGSVDWAAPLALDLGGGTLSVTLEDTVFNGGILGLSPGSRLGADVRATFLYTTPVPLPAGAGLILAGLAALGLLARRRRPA